VKNSGQNSEIKQTQINFQSKIASLLY